jgi:tRNA-splicing ligase RtcB
MSALRVWGRDLIEDGTIEQAEKAARLPFVDGLALMPDAHIGKGSTIGSVIPTRGAIIPAAVGVDIGCGMVAVETVLGANDLPDDLGPFVSAVAERIPAGVGKLQHRYRFWRACCIATWVLAAAVIVMESR